MLDAASSGLPQIPEYGLPQGLLSVMAIRGVASLSCIDLRRPGGGRLSWGAFTADQRS